MAFIEGSPRLKEATVHAPIPQNSHYLANAQCCGNVVPTLSLARSDTMFLHHCHKVEDKCYITTLWQRWYNNVAMLPQHWKIM